MLPLPDLNIQIHPNDAREIVDWAIRGAEPPPPHVLRVLTVVRHLMRSGYPNFVETGTYLGATTEIVAKLGRRVVTVELSPELHARAAERFRPLPNVTCLKGDSGTLMPSIVDGLDGPAVFWLDGHYSDVPYGGRGEKETPIVEELTAVLTDDRFPHIVLIDDVRCFGQGDYPTVAEIEALVRRHRPDHAFTVLNDIMRIVPPGMDV